MMTDSFGNDFLQIMKSKNNPEAFPRIEVEYNLAERDYESNRNLRIIDRVQIQRSPTRYEFLLRHPTRYHWCGYVLLSRQVWQDRKETFESQAGKGFISYAFPGFEPLCWMVRNNTGLLKKAVDVNPAGDFFVGFELSRLSRDVSMDQEKATDILTRFSNLIYWIADDHPTA